MPGHSKSKSVFDITQNFEFQIMKKIACINFESLPITMIYFLPVWRLSNSSNGAKHKNVSPEHFSFCQKRDVWGFDFVRQRRLLVEEESLRYLVSIYRGTNPPLK